MKVLNIHKRIIYQSPNVIGQILDTLASDADMIIAKDKWSPMKLDKGLVVGSKGGHGPIKYSVIEYQPSKSIIFEFDLKGFNGFHKFEIVPLKNNFAEIKHMIDMNTSGLASIKWALAIRWLHDAYIEDAFDNVENYFLREKKNSKWSLWVRLLRRVLRPKNK
jgi:hypothetical protein